MKDKFFTQTLAKAATGIIKADIVVKNINLINVNTKEIIPNIDIAIKSKKICLVGDASHTIDKHTKIIDGTNKYASPGFMDSHMHIESSMLKPSEFSNAVIPNGTTSVFYDPHEICNVLGLDGVKMMLDDIKSTPINSFLTIPSCVPALSEFEDSNAVIKPVDIDEWMKRDDVIGLGEMMNMPGVIAGDDSVHEILNNTHKYNKIVTGHYATHDIGHNLNAYIATGIRCCHESTRFIDALTKMRLGMYAQFREGSAWQDLEELAPIIAKSNIDSRFACLVTDDSHPNTIMEKGHINYIVKKAIKLGIDPITAIQMVTINPATCFKLDDEYGSISPYKYADILIIDNLDDLNIETVIIKGNIVFNKSEEFKESKGIEFPKSALNSIKINYKTVDDFKVNYNKEEAQLNIIEIIPSSALSKHTIDTLRPVDNNLVSDINKDILKIAVIDRHKNNGIHSIGFVKGFGLKKGALAQTVSHDAHNIVVIGTTDEDITAAVNALIDMQGGIVCVDNQKVIASVNLNIAGLMSIDNYKVVANKINTIEKTWKELGCKIESPFMTMSILSLSCIQELRITNKGLVDSNNYKFIDLIIK
ncbi:MAG: adenine deaminase [Anaeroplasmataceae bacterium]